MTIQDLHGKKIARLERLLSSCIINLATLVDKMHEASNVEEEDFLNSIRQDVEEAKDILGVK